MVWDSLSWTKKLLEIRREKLREQLKKIPRDEKILNIILSRRWKLQNEKFFIPTYVSICQPAFWKDCMISQYINR